MPSMTELRPGAYRGEDTDVYFDPSITDLPDWYGVHRQAALLKPLSDVNVKDVKPSSIFSSAADAQKFHGSSTASIPSTSRFKKTKLGDVESEDVIGPSSMLKASDYFKPTDEYGKMKYGPSQYVPDAILSALGSMAKLPLYGLAAPRAAADLMMNTGDKVPTGPLAHLPSVEDMQAFLKRNRRFLPVSDQLFETIAAGPRTPQGEMAADWAPYLAISGMNPAGALGRGAAGLVRNAYYLAP